MTYGPGVLQEVYDLLGQGVGLVDVASRTGASVRSVRRWRAEVGGMSDPSLEVSARYLSRAERYEIARLHDAGLSVRAIAAAIERSASTVSRELRRRERPVGAPGRPVVVRGRRYQPEAAHQAAVRARARPKASKVARSPRLRAWVQHRLNERLSPAQIAGRVEVAFPEDEEMRISHESIYRAIYIAPRGELRRELRAHLRTGRSQRKTRSTRERREKRGPIVDAVSIHHRPEEIEDRLVPGHYEGDLVVGPAGSRAAVGTLVERTSGHISAFLLSEKTTAATIAGLTTTLTRTGWPMKSLTWDRGTEMAGHAGFTIDTGIAVYFADPHAPWQRGSNESANGLLREYFPKGTDFAHVSDADLQAAVDQLNNRPRKRLGFYTPNETITAMLTGKPPIVATTE